MILQNSMYKIVFHLDNQFRLNSLFTTPSVTLFTIHEKGTGSHNYTDLVLLNIQLTFCLLS